MAEKEPKEKRYDVKYTEAEIYARVEDLRASKDMELFMRVEKGAREFNEMQKLAEIIEKESEKDAAEKKE